MKPEDVPEGPILLDTDVSSWLYTKRNDETWLTLLTGRLLAISFVSMGEMLAGFIKLGWGDKKLRIYREHVRTHLVVVPFNAALVDQWARLHAKLSGHLQRGGANDMWIAATALSQSPPLPVATGNLTDFGKISGETGLRLVHPDL